MATLPNILLVCVDQWRGDGLSIDGHPVVHTPYLDQLAMGGVRFSKAYTAVPSCIAARASLMTGLTPRSHGRVGYLDGVEWNYQTTLAGEFTKHGYQTQAIGKMHAHPARTQLGFQNVILHDGYLHFCRDRRLGLNAVDDYQHWLMQELGPDADYFDHGMNCNAYTARPWGKAEYLHPTNWVTQQGIDFFRRRDPRKPFFLYLSYHRPHPPLDPPAWAFEQYLQFDMPPPPVGDWASDFEKYHQSFRPDLNSGRLPRQVLQRARAGYYGHLTHIDHQLNRLFEALREWGVDGNTWIMFVSDHGDLLGDHHLFRKCMPYEGSARIPMILKGPGGSGVPGGCVFDQAVELRDVMPTLLECAGLSTPESVEGKSLMPLIQGKANQWRPYVHGEHTVASQVGPWLQSVQWLTDGREKYVWFGQTGREQLFDLCKDPHELCDLARSKGAEARVKPWRQALVAELAGREEGFVDGNRLVTGKQVQACLAHIRAKG